MPKAGKKYVYGLFLDKNTDNVDGLYETECANELAASEYFIEAYSLTEEDMQNATIKLLSIQNDNLPEIPEKDSNVHNKTTSHYAFRVPCFDENGKFSHYMQPVCETVPEFCTSDERFDLMFDSSDEAMGFITEHDILPEAEANEWLLVRIVETPIKRC